MEEINLGSMTLADTLECIDILENPEKKPETLERNKKRVQYKILQWKMNPFKGYGMYAIQSEKYPLEPDAAFFEKIGDQMKKDGYFIESRNSKIAGPIFFIDIEPIPSFE